MYPQITWKCKQTSSPNKGSNFYLIFSPRALFSPFNTETKEQDYRQNQQLAYPVAYLPAQYFFGIEFTIGKMTVQAFHLPVSNARCVSNNHCHEAKVKSGQLARPDGSPVLGRKQLYTKRNTITTCFFVSLPAHNLLIRSKRRSATSPVFGWRQVQTASQPSLRRQRFTKQNFQILDSLAPFCFDAGGRSCCWKMETNIFFQAS